MFSVGTIVYIHQNIDNFAKRSKKHQENILLKQAQVHYEEQMNTRRWNAGHGGIYVKPHNNLKPNPHLEDNILKVDDNLTLIKINPAWMTRQLSELLSSESFKFRIVSLKPINPINKSDAFESKALKYFENTNDREFYEFENEKFRYVGALVTKKECLNCHAAQGYKVGDIRGGISISFSTEEYNKVINSLKDQTFHAKIVFTTLAIVLTLLIHKQLKQTYNLGLEVQNRTREINNTKNILQHILDADRSFLFVLDDTKIVMANKTMLNFFGYKTVEEFSKDHEHISDMFEKNDSGFYLQHFMNGEHWIHYLQREQAYKNLKVKLKSNNVQKIFKPSAKEVSIDNKKLHIVIFDDITNELRQIEKLKKEAAKDTLTRLFNRGKFQEILIQEMALANSTMQPLSVIFLDIDFFKKVNDDYGHDVGDKVLVSLSKILKENMRLGDSVSRWGGEEFIILLQSTPVNQAVKIAEKLRKKVSEYKFDKVKNVNISLGVTQYISTESDKALLKRVDEALYEAKNTGRNKVIMK